MGKELAAEIEFYDFMSEDFSDKDCPLAYSIPETREGIYSALKGRPLADPALLRRLRAADKAIVELIQNLPDDYDEDDPSQPPEKWWWHLKEIKAGTFPKEHLPHG